MFADYHAQVDNIPRVGEQPSNIFVRETADDFYRAQETRGAPMAYGAPGQILHYGYLPPPVDSDVVPFGPSSAPIPIPDSLADLRPEILAIHTWQQANLRTRAEGQQRNHVRNARRMDAMRGNLQPVRPPVEDPPPPSPYRMGETSFERQERTRPSAQRPIITDGDFRQCAICLEHFGHRERLWRLQCGHMFHAECWDRMAHTHTHTHTSTGRSTETPTKPPALFAAAWGSS